MPKLSDIDYIRNEILQIGDEKETLDEWGEPFEPLPIPKDADSGVTAENGADKNLGVNASQGKANDVAPPKNAHIFDDVVNHKESANKEALSDILSSIDLDSEEKHQALDEGLEVPEELLSDGIEAPKPVPETFVDEAHAAQTQFDEDADLTKHDGESIFAGGTELNDALFDTTDFNADEDAPITEKADDNLKTESTDESDSSLELPSFDDFDLSDMTLPDESEHSDDKADFSTDDFTTDFNFDNDMSEQDSTNVGVDDSHDTVDDIYAEPSDTFSNVGSNDENDIIGSDAEIDKAESEEAEDAYQPVEELKNVEIPEIDEATGFAKKDEQETPSDVSFAPPKRFENFADDAGQAFVTPKHTELSNADMAGDIPLAISDQDFKKFLKELNAMPLNLRQEIQHYIAYEDDLEVNKMELVDLIVKGASLKQVVKYLEANLKKTIKIPKGFDKKSFEEFEREKKTFKYRFRHQILPLVTIAGIFTLLICSILVIAWHFIYKPVMAEQYYKDGLFYIDSGKNTTAFEKFDKAGTYWKKKRWYFRYANEFITKKQYSAAEQIYLRLLTDFNHDVEGGIAYSEMLSRELRDYQRAEIVLRRQVIDYHPNSNEAFYALANLFLDWGLENSEKLHEAKKIFDQLVLQNGHNDAYDAGLMKYYIRTDNLEKVLPFKDLFLTQGGKLTQADFNELAGYLVTCRYEPSSRITTALKNQINDVREVLERALKLNEADAEANYNLGRFFVYNYKLDEAEYYLKKAYENYGNDVLPLAQFFKKLDAMRLYGEVFLQKEQHLEAETIFSNALNLYRSYSAISEVPANKIVGKLFEDYGNIKYFIASDYELARESFIKAAAQNADSPELRYKLGYIYYTRGDYNQAASEFGRTIAEKSTDPNALFSLGNALFKRADYYVAQAYYERLLENLEAEKLRRKIMLPQVREHDTLFVENYMKATNNLAVTLNRLAVQNGNSEMNSRSFVLFAESTRAWDALTRNPQTLIRTKNRQSPAYVNIQYMTAPNKNFVPEIYTEIPLTLQNDPVMVQLK